MHTLQLICDVDFSQQDKTKTTDLNRHMHEQKPTMTPSRENKEEAIKMKNQIS